MDHRPQFDEDFVCNAVRALVCMEPEAAIETVLELLACRPPDEEPILASGAPAIPPSMPNAVLGRGLIDGVSEMTMALTVWAALGGSMLELVGKAGVAAEELESVLTDVLRGQADETVAAFLDELPFLMLQGAGPDVRTLLPSLIGWLGHASPARRAWAARALGAVAAEARSAVPALTAALEDRDANVRDWAARALGKIGPPAAPAVPMLIRMLACEDAHLRYRAAIALEGIGPGAASAVSALARALEDDEVLVRMWAASALGEIGPAAEAAIPALTKALRDPDPDVRYHAFETIYRLGPRVSARLPADLRAAVEGSRRLPTG